MAERDAGHDGDRAGAELRHDQRGHGLAWGGAERPHHRMVAGRVPRGEGRHDDRVDGGERQQQAGRAEYDGPDLVVEDGNGGIAGALARTSLA